MSQNRTSNIDISVNIGDIITFLQPNLSDISLNILTNYHKDLWRTARVIKKKQAKKHFFKQKVSHFWGSHHELAVILSSNIQKSWSFGQIDLTYCSLMEFSINILWWILQVKMIGLKNVIRARWFQKVHYYHQLLGSDVTSAWLADIHNSLTFSG